MRKSIFKNAYFSLIGLLLAAAIILIICQLIFNVYMQPSAKKSSRSSSSKKRIATSPQRQSLSPINYPTILNNARKQLGTVNKKRTDLYKQTPGLH
ncbi:MAG: hypothetical protein JW734_02790 [Candidatus Omnitrophica bacterium]|nr:hypothetical protein [Candidatus Omnitrophota bacterium]